MRTFGALVLGLLIASADAMAQPGGSTVDRAIVSVEGGLTFATLSSYQTPDIDEAFDTSPCAGVTVGGALSLPLSSRLSLRPGVLFAQKGAKIRFAGSTETDAVVDLRYLEIPVLLRFQASSGGVRAFVNAGPSFAFKLRARVDASASGGSSDVDIDSEVRTFDAGVAVGAGVEGGHWSVELRVVQGVIDIGNSLQVDDVVRTRTISLLVGLRF